MIKEAYIAGQEAALEKLAAPKWMKVLRGLEQGSPKRAYIEQTLKNYATDFERVKILDDLIPRVKSKNPDFPTERWKSAYKLTPSQYKYLRKKLDVLGEPWEQRETLARPFLKRERMKGGLKNPKWYKPEPKVDTGLSTSTKILIGAGTAGGVGAGGYGIYKYKKDEK